MKIELRKITINEIVSGYRDSQEDGIVGYGGQLNIRPAFQREFIYKDKQRDEVINTVRRGFPLNVMYWVKNVDGNYELLDGQQRTVSICKYVVGEYSINYQYFHNLTNSEKQQILEYSLMIYVCEGTDKEKLDWFEIINIAGEKLTQQELRNAIYTGEWLTDAKKYFSKTNCPAYNIASDYLNGSAIRQDYLETAIRWIAHKEDKEIRDYMADHQDDTNANELWLYFNTVINWTLVTFPNYRKEMKGLEWGIYYNKYGAGKYDSKLLEREIIRLLEDEDVTKTSGIYEYLLDKDEKHLNIRAFSEKIKRISYEKQKGICVHCKKHYEYRDMEGDHVTPWRVGGKTVLENCQMLCVNCNRRKSGK